MYATIVEMIARLGEQAVILASDRDGQGAINEACLLGALEDATAEIDGSLSARYALPLPHTPKLVQRLCIDLARYFASSDAGTLTDDIRKRAEDARATLKCISRGDIKLGLPASQEPVSAPAPQVITGRQHFGGGRFSGF